MSKETLANSTIDLVRQRIRDNIEVKERLLSDDAFQRLTIEVAVQIAGSLLTGGKVFFFGNGGSAADAQHLAAEFTGRYLKERRPLAALALNANTSSVTAIGNDYGFDLIFARQIEALGRAGDVAIGISTSGNSANVVRALEMARSRSMHTVALTGGSGGILASVVDRAICIPSYETPRIQECHILAGHIICEIVECMISEQLEPEIATSSGAQIVPEFNESLS